MALSIVIATLGGEQLSKTIYLINSGTLVPDEILICIPNDLAFRVNGMLSKKIKIVKTAVYGQVAQRAEGFKQARYDFVLQLDDDIDLSPNSLMLMMTHLMRLGRNNVVGPVFINKKHQTPLSPFPVGLKGFLINLYYYIFGALPFGKARMGALSSICVTSSIDPRFSTGEVMRTDWLAGGCVLGYRDDLIKDNFFPFEGKAYAEDGLHSFLRTTRGISHHVVVSATAAIDVPSNSFEWRGFVREMSVRLKIVRLMQGNSLRKLLYISAEGVRRVLWRSRA